MSGKVEHLGVWLTWREVPFEGKSCIQPHATEAEARKAVAGSRRGEWWFCEFVEFGDTI